MSGPVRPGDAGGTAYGSGPSGTPVSGALTERSGRDRRDALVVGACLWSVALQAVPPALIAGLGYGAQAAADVALVALSSPVLLGAVAFAVTLAVAMRRPGLDPTKHVVTWPVDDRARPRLRVRLRWAALAAVVDIAVLAAALLVDGGVRSGAAAFLEALDDGSAEWTFALLFIQGGFVDLRAPVAFGVAWVVLARALRPVRPR
jgi:hypothetical protein